MELGLHFGSKLFFGTNVDNFYQFSPTSNDPVVSLTTVALGANSVILTDNCSLESFCYLGLLTLAWDEPAGWVGSFRVS